MADLFGGPVIEKLINACSDYLQDQVGWQTGMKPEMRRLKVNLIKIKAVVAASSQVQITDQNQDLMAWRWQLRDAIDEADDLLDDFEYMKLKEQLTTRENMEKGKKRSAATTLLFESARKIRNVGGRALRTDPNLRRLKEVVQKLDKVLAEIGTFLDLVENSKQEQQKQEIELLDSRETGCLPKNDLIGRREDMEFVMQWLRKTSNEDPTHINSSTSYKNISLLSIVGHGGMGKTTLLQHVYDDLKTEFELKMWVCVSNYFDPKKVIANILEHCAKDSSESLAVLQRNLKSIVWDKKFLLVLDDIWEEEEEQDISKWEKVLAPLISGSFGSKILVTTRMDSVALMIAKVIGKKKITLRLNGLKEDESLQLLSTHAFANVDNHYDHKKLRCMAREIVKKLSGSPLAAKVIGGVLNSSLDERHWMRVLTSDIGSAELGQNNIMPILRLSYTFLPKPLQNCFAFCSILPKDKIVYKDDLVRMWISLGFIQTPSIQGVTIEDIGGRYFDILVKKSFFDQDDHSLRYTVHDLLHELAQSISAHECFQFVGNKGISFAIPETTRHLFVNTTDLEVLRKIKNLKNMHSLFVTYQRGDQEFIDLLADIFRASKSIRLLFINSKSLEVLPETIENLTHLRYLDFYYTKVTRLPRSLSSLYHLQFIISRQKGMNTNEEFLPKDMKNLTNLRYLKMPQKVFSWMSEIGKLSYLQKLNGFYIKDENGFRIVELEHMNMLRSLNIKFLENVRDAKEAYSVKLCNKSYLTDLSLDWSDTEKPYMKRKIVDPNLDEKVLENLQPPNNLNKLLIRSYMGAKSAKWMDDVKLISNLEEIKLNDCLKWEILPPFEQLPFLKSLYLYNLPKVKRFNDKFCVFPSLERLRIERLEALEDWFDAAGAPEDECLLPSLTELYLEACPNLLELPTLPPKLEKLEMNRVGCRALKWKQGISNCCSISKSILLKTLKVVGCPNLTSLPLADETVRFEALDLTIRDCPNLNSLGGLQDVGTSENFKLILSDLTISDPSVLLMEPLRSIASIQKLQIVLNDELVSFPSEAQQWFLQDRSSLRELRIIYLKSLQSLPSSLESLSSLEILELSFLPQLQLLPNMPASLENLQLGALESLQNLPSFLSTLHNSSLKHLELYRIPLLKSLPDLPRSLCYLKINNLDKIDCLPSGIANLSSLQDLSISNFPQLRELPDLPRSLCYLFIDNLDKIDFLPSSIASLSSLRDLTIFNVPQLRELPDLPPSLKYLRIIDCHPELKERYEKPSGSDLQKFAHIPDLQISFDDDELGTLFIRAYGDGFTEARRFLPAQNH